MKSTQLPIRRLVFFTVIILAIALSLLLWFRPLVREVIIIPLSYWAWLIGLFLKSTPQIFFWVVTLLIISMIAWRSFFAKGPPVEFIEKAPNYSSPGGRVSYWLRRVELMRMGVYYQSTFNEALGRLALDLISYRHRITNRQVERGLSSNSLRMPTPVRDFLLKNVFQREFKTVSYFVYLYRALRLWWMTHFSARIGIRARPLEDELSPEAHHLIQYMEKELEVNYEHPGR